MPLGTKMLVENKFSHPTACRQVRNMKENAPHFVPNGTKNHRDYQYSTNILSLTGQKI